MTLRIGTRRSRLALAQALEIERLLSSTGAEIEIVPIVTSGDRGAPAGPAGVKGLFVGEIVSALQRGEIDVAVHSAKDLPAEEPEGIVVAAVPRRLDPRDVLVHRGERWSGGTIGTSSIRRSAQLARTHTKAKVVELRGNVDTRLGKLQAGEVDALVLAVAGLRRLGLQPEFSTPLSVEEMVPAPGQGALAVQARDDDDATCERLRSFDHAESRRAFDAERRLMALLGGGCALPLGALADASGDDVHLRSVVVSPDGAELLSAEATAEDPGDAAAAVARELLAAGAAELLDRAREAGTGATS
ncbi:MAG: hydroxymethylbilane synthase [Actinomycetota bacterium]